MLRNEQNSSEKSLGVLLFLKQGRIRKKLQRQRGANVYL